MSKLLFPAFPMMPNQQAGWVRSRLALALALVVLLIIFAGQLRGCIDNPPNWFPGKNKTELAVENTDLRNQITDVVKVNEQNADQKATEKEAEQIVEAVIEEQKVKTSATVAKVEKVKTQTKEKIKVIEKSPDLTEKQKDEQVVAAAADSMWDSLCAIQPGSAGCPS